MAIILDNSLFCVLLQKLMYSFWEKIAADVLQPEFSKESQSYITQMLGLHKTGGNVTFVALLCCLTVAQGPEALLRPDIYITCSVLACQRFCLANGCAADACQMA